MRSNRNEQRLRKGIVLWGCVNGCITPPLHPHLSRCRSPWMCRSCADHHLRSLFPPLSLHWDHWTQLTDEGDAGDGYAGAVGGDCVKGADLLELHLCGRERFRSSSLEDSVILLCFLLLLSFRLVSPLDSADGFACCIPRGTGGGN